MDTEMEIEPIVPDAAAELADLKAKLAAAESNLVATATGILAGVPAHLKALVPANITPAEQIAWFNAAKATGVFDRPAVAVTETGTKPTITPVIADPASLPLYARMAAGYRK